MSELQTPPPVGLGTWKISKPSTAETVVTAAKLGYRHFDCACDYGNEAQVGDGFSAVFGEGIAARDEVWVTSKLWNTYHEPQYVRPALERTLSDLKIDHVDLYHIHFPIALKYVAPEVRYPPEWFHDPDADAPKMEPIDVPYIDTYREMEKLVEAGLARNIGVCNLGTSQLRDLLTQCSIRPKVLQVEMHPHLPQDRLLRFCKDEGIHVTAFSSFGATSYVGIGMAEAHETLLDDPTIVSIAEKYGRSPAQVLLRWGLQRGTSVIPKGDNEDHLSQNIASGEFTLEADDLAAISTLENGRRYNDPGEFCERAFNTFFPIFD